MFLLTTNLQIFLIDPEDSVQLSGSLLQLLQACSLKFMKPSLKIHIVNQELLFVPCFFMLAGMVPYFSPFSLEPSPHRSPLAYSVPKVYGCLT